MNLFRSWFGKAERTPVEAQPSSRPASQSQSALAPLVFVDSAREVAEAMASLRSRCGKPVVVNHWATWCEPCMAEMPFLAAMAARYRGRIEFLGISWERFTEDGPADSIRAALDDVRAAHGVFYENIVAPPPASEFFDILQLKQQLIPQTFLYDSAGNCRFEYCGGIESGVPRAQFERILAIVAEGGVPDGH